MSKDRILQKFHREKETAISIYQRYILNGIGLESTNDFKTGLEIGILGNREFIDDIHTKVCVKNSRKVELLDLISKVCETHDLTQEELRTSGKHSGPSQARALLSHLVREADYLSLEELGKFLNRDPSGLTKLADRFKMKAIDGCLAAVNLQEMQRWLGELI